MVTATKQNLITLVIISIMYDKNITSSHKWDEAISCSRHMQGWWLVTSMTYSSGTSASRQINPSTNCRERSTSMAATSAGLMLPPLATPPPPPPPPPPLWPTSAELPAVFPARDISVEPDTCVNADAAELGPWLPFNKGTVTPPCVWSGTPVSFLSEPRDTARVFSSKEVIWGIVAEPSNWRMASASDWFSRMYFNVKRIISRALCTRHVAILLWVRPKSTLQERHTRTHIWDALV